MTDTSPKISVILADDHGIVREGLKLILQQNAGIKIVAEACNGLEAVGLVNLHQPDVLVCDISMPVMNGIEVARALSQHQSKTNVLFLTMQDKEEYIMEAMQVGAIGFLPKGTVSEELVKAIQAVARGKEYFSESVYSKAFRALRLLNQKTEIRLTPRETEVLQLLSKGLSTKMIAEKLVVSEYTVSNHRANLLRKLSANNVAELMSKAQELGLL
ncbi:response regulator transcription factor [Cesiribacter sp. SM1]|uniref:response regulator n=1 Tax=Cesiribacter sp. SM1 TaxID=2861196 RepID=UPI001CD19C03|nr:response regulator transcription factor [Cesiribacter sp. SM1]